MDLEKLEKSKKNLLEQLEERKKIKKLKKKTEEESDFSDKFGINMAKGGRVGLKNGGKIARGCGKVMPNRRKKTKTY
jgi:hypothetical protein